MEIVLIAGGIALLVWLVAKGRGATAPSPSRSAEEVRTPAATADSTRSGRAKGARTMTADECWVPPGGEATVAGYTIHGGMLYIGQGLVSVAGHGVEPALINPGLSVKRSSPAHDGSSMPYWPSYSSISPECRAAYLHWLATGRRDPNAYIGYVFLFFYGLERRALAEAAQSERARRDLLAIRVEVEQLLYVYSGNGSFRGYATRFLDVLGILGAGGNAPDPPLERDGSELPLSLRVGIGRIVAAGKPLPPDWALSWFLTHPETSLRTPARRCSVEFGELFRRRYIRKFGEGLLIKASRSMLRLAITPASGSFGGQIRLSLDLPDIAAVTAPFRQLHHIGEECATDLDAYSRWVGRNSGAPRTVAAVALLPPELVTTHDSQEARGLWAWIAQIIDGRDTAICSTDDLLQHCVSFGSGKLAKAEAVLLAQLLEKGGYGIEPDVRFGGAPLAPGGTTVVFKLLPEATAIASPQYAATTILLHLAVAVSAADGALSELEKQHLQQHLQKALALSKAERLRLSAHLAWLMSLPPGLAGLRKRLESLDQRQRSTIADFIIGVAGADGQISPEEIRTLGKVYPMLGLAAEGVYRHVHAMAAGTATGIEDADLVRVSPAQESSGYAIPPRPGPAPAVRLNMSAVRSKLAESAQISAILGDIFTEDDAVSLPEASVAGASIGNLSPAYVIFLSRLAERPEWSRAEFEALAAECRLLPDGAVDGLNEAAFEVVGGPVLEGHDPIQVDQSTARELLT